MANIEERIGLGPLVGNATIFNAPTLTTSTKATLANGSVVLPNQFLRVTIVNGSLTSYVAYRWVAVGASNPNITADFNAITGGIAIPPGQGVEFSIAANIDLYVAAAASSGCCVASVLYQQ